MRIAFGVRVVVSCLLVIQAEATQPSIDQEPVSQRVTLNLQAAFSIAASGTSPLSYQWFKNGAALSLATNAQLLLQQVQFSDEGLYSVTVSNAEGTATSTNASLVVSSPRAGDLDGTFISSPNAAVLSVGVREDQSVLIAGAFTAVDGSPRPCLAVLGPNGMLSDFYPFINGGNALLRYAAFMPSEILIAGTFQFPSDVEMRSLGRISLEGSPDSNFGLSGGSLYEALTAAVQTNGVTVAATFYNGSPFYGGITWLDPGGSPYASMTFGTNTVTRSIALQSDGKTLIGGYFNLSNNVGIIRLNPDRSVDSTFNCVVLWGNGLGDVYSVLLQADGKILIGGSFDRVNGKAFNSVARLNPDGTLDDTFQNALTYTAQVYCLAQQPDAKILVGGDLVLVRFNSDGSLDTSFAPPIVHDLTCVSSIALQRDNKIIIGGTFTKLNGLSAPYIARCWGTDYPPVMKNLSVSADGVNLGWHAISNRTYRVQYTEGLQGTNWTDLSGDVLATTDTAAKLDPSSASAPGQRFYRVLALP